MASIFSGLWSKPAQKLVHPALILRPVELSDLAFQLSDNAFFLEALNILYFGSDGSFLHCSFAIASIPLSKHSVLMNTKSFSPTCVEQQFQQAHKLKALTWSEDRASCTFPNGSFIQYDHSERKYSVNLRYEAAEAGTEDDVFEFEVVADCGEGLKVDDGNVYYDEAKQQVTSEPHCANLPAPADRPSDSCHRCHCSRQFWKNVYYPRCRACGRTPTAPEWTGVAFVGRLTSNVPVQSISAEMHHFKMYDARNTLTMVDLAAPRGFGYERYRLGCFVRDGRIVAVTQGEDSHVKWHAAEVLPDAVSGYNVPTDYEYVWGGQTLDGRPFSASVRFPAVAPMLSKVDVLAHIPSLLRWVVQKLIGRPFIFLWLTPVGDAAAPAYCSAGGGAKSVGSPTGQVSVGDEKIELGGVALHEIHYINPPPPPQSQ